MSTPWIVAFGILSLAVAILATMMLGLTRRVLEVLLRVEATLGASVASERGSGLRVGDSAPRLPAVPPESAARQTGRQTAGTLVVFLEADCEPCRVLAEDIHRRRLDPHPYQAFAIVDDPEAFDRSFPAPWSVVPDYDHTLSLSWQVLGTPAAFLIDNHGTIRGNNFANSGKDLLRLMKQDGDVASLRRHRSLLHIATVPKTEMSHHDH